MKLKPYYLGLVMLILLGLTASSAFGVGSAGTVTGGTFPACIDPANTNTSTVKIGGKQVAPGGLVRAPVGTTCLSSETTLNLNSYVKTILVSPGPDNVVNGNNLRTAVNNAPTRTLVKVEPGTFDLATTPLIMKQGVDLEGSGEGLTTITSQIVSANLPLTSGTVVLASSSEVRFLSILNTGNGGSTLNSAVYSTGVNITSKLTNVTVSTNGNSSGNYGIYNNINSSPSIQNTTISATGGSINYGFYNYNSSSPIIENSTISVGVGSSNNYGIYNVFYSAPAIQNSTITVSGSSTQNKGIYNSNSSPIVQNSTITVSESSANNYGMQNIHSFPTVQNSTISVSVSGPGFTYGIYNELGSSSTIQHSTISSRGGSSNSVFNDPPSSVKVGSSQLDGILVGGGSFTCVASYDANFVALGPNCT